MYPSYPKSTGAGTIAPQSASPHLLFYGCECGCVNLDVHVDVDVDEDENVCVYMCVCLPVSLDVYFGVCILILFLTHPVKRCKWIVHLICKAVSVIE